MNVWLCLSRFRFLCVCMGLCVRERRRTTQGVCVSYHGWTGPVTMMSSTWLVSTPIAVEGTNTFGALLSSLLEVLIVFWVSWLFCCVLLATRVRAKTSYITISSSSDSGGWTCQIHYQMSRRVKDDEKRGRAHLRGNWSCVRSQGPCVVFTALYSLAMHIGRIHEYDNYSLLVGGSRAGPR